MSISSVLEPTIHGQLRSSSSKRDDAHNVAIVLNNTGVTLLQNSCYLLAAESFRDALHVLKLVTACAVTDNNQDIDIDVELSIKLTNVSKRLIECDRIQVSKGNTSCTCTSRNLSILKYDGTASSIFNAAIDPDVFDDEMIRSHAIKRFAIQICDHHLRCRSLEIDTAIILYNYGVSFRYFLNCQSFLMKANDQELKDAMYNSKRLFVLSHDILIHMSSINNDDNDNDSDFNEEHILIPLLSCLVTMSLLHNAIDSDTPDEALQYRYQMMNYKRISVLYHSLELHGKHNAAAA